MWRRLTASWFYLSSSRFSNRCREYPNYVPDRDTRHNFAFVLSIWYLFKRGFELGGKWLLERNHWHLGRGNGCIIIGWVDNLYEMKLGRVYGLINGATTNNLHGNHHQIIIHTYIASVRYAGIESQQNTSPEVSTYYWWRWQIVLQDVFQSVGEKTHITSK
jgi:hypothetical protein